MTGRGWTTHGCVRAAAGAALALVMALTACSTASPSATFGSVKCWSANGTDPTTVPGLLISAPAG